MRVNLSSVRGGDPSTNYTQGLDALKKCSELMSNSYVPAGFGNIYYNMAEYDIEKGKDPSSLLDLSRMSLQKSIEIDPANYEPYEFSGRSETLAARWAMKSGQSPMQYFQKGRKIFSEIN